MTTITLPPDLEESLAAEARRRGTTAESLAIDHLRRLFAPSATTWTADATTLYDLLSEQIGAVDGTSEPLSDDCGRRFADGLSPCSARAPVLR